MSQAQLISDSLDPIPKQRLEPVDVITTVNGGTDTAYAAARSGVLIGYESSETRPPDEIPIDFVDWPFRKIDEGSAIDEVFEQHLAVVKRERPKYAVAPDIDEHVGYIEAIQYALKLQRYCDTVIVVPKSVHPRDVPRQFRVGMPCQDRFGGTPHPWTEYANCKEVHLLGGNPAKQTQIGKYYVPVCSLDTAVPISRARWGKVWTGKKFIRKRKGFYGSIEESFATLWREWNPDRYSSSREMRWKYPKPLSGNPIYDNDPFEVEDYLMDDEEIPFPGRAWCYENDVEEWREKNTGRGIDVKPTS